MWKIKQLLYMSVGLFAMFAFSGMASAVAGTTPYITSATYTEGCNKILVQFNEPVFSNATLTAGLAIDGSDFTYNDTLDDSMVSISSAFHTAGNKWAVLTMNANAAAGDIGETLNAKANNIFTVGSALSEKTVTLAADSTTPTFTAKYKQASDKLVVTFTERVWGVSQCTAAFDDATNALGNAKFVYTEGAGAGAGGAGALGTAAQHMSNRTEVVLDLNAVLAAGDISDAAESINIAGPTTTTVFDLFGHGVATAVLDFGSAGTTSDATGVSISGVEAVVGKPYIKVSFDEIPSTGDPTSATVTALDTGAASLDLTYTDTTQTSRILAVADLAHVAGNDWAIIKLSTNIAVTDMNSDTLNILAGGAILDVFGNAAASITAVNLYDSTVPVLLSSTFNQSGGKNILTLVYSEGVQFTSLSPTAGGLAIASTALIGDVTTAGTIAGFGAFATTGDVTYTTSKNSVLLSSDSTTFTITMAGQTGGLKTAGSTMPSGTFTPTADVRDVFTAFNAIEVLSLQRTITTTLAWDVVATAVAGLAPSSAGTTQAIVGWTATADPAFYSYQVYYRTTTGVTKDNGSGWTNSNDTALLTVGTTSTTITGLNSGTVYYMTLYNLDTFGNYSTAATEINIQTNSGTRADRVAPGAPSSVKAESKDGKAVLTWVDPTDTDLREIIVLRGKNEFPVDGNPYALVAKGVKIYTDSNAVAGDKVKYILRGKDNANNESVNSTEVSVTVVAAAPVTPVTPVVETPVTPPAEEVAPPAEEEKVEEKTPAQIAKEKKIDALQKKIDALNVKITKEQAKITKLQAKIAKTKSKVQLKAYKKQLVTYQKQLATYQKQVKAYEKQMVKLQK